MKPRILEGKDALKAVTILLGEYPDAHYYLNFKTDVGLMVAAIISAQTRDEVVNSVTPALFGRYKTIDDYAGAEEKELAGIISRVSFAGNKAKNIIKACREIKERHGGKIPRSMEELTELPGIGRKTANTILINAYGIVEGIPVDTWVIKLSQRIGLSASGNPEAIEKDLMKLVDKKDWRKLAYVLKAHGRSVCRSVMPLCSRCVIMGMCPKNGVSRSG